MAKLPKALSATDFQVLLVLAAGDLYGYAILKAMEEDSGGAVRPGTKYGGDIDWYLTMISGGP